MADATYYSLGSKKTFNKALRHFFKVSELVDEVESKNNIADIINDELDEEEISPEQVLPIIGAIIRDKFNYSYKSIDMFKNVSDFKKVITETEKWTAMDIVLIYVKSNGNIVLINPKNETHWEEVGKLKERQLLVVYSKYIKEDDGNEKLEKEAIDAVLGLLAGKDVYINNDFIDKTVQIKKSVPRKAASTPTATATGSLTGKKCSTPRYSVQVSNELFHNGNVEAWKKILESYKAIFPDLEVSVYYEGEKINDINALFQWGKVKHGGLIFFQVTGENILGVSKLQKYLFEGASQRYEAFLHGSIGSVLNLF